ncbi:hypothetical protein ALO85_200150 [Pseudomonas syringae pv. aptata]|nr:hypothetical protein ALO85_200150 [Pseudomonas syringae pv. aptata]
MPDDVQRYLSSFFETVDGTNVAILYHSRLLGCSPMHSKLSWDERVCFHVMASPPKRRSPGLAACKQ